MKFQAKLERIEGELGFWVPGHVVRKFDIKDGDELFLDIPKRKSYFGVLRGVGKFTEMDRFDRR